MPADVTNDYTYDALNRVTSIQQYGTDGNAVNDKRVDFAYNALGQYTRESSFNNLDGNTSTHRLAYTDYTYDSANRLTLQTQHNAGTTITRGLAYDVAGRIVSQSEGSLQSDFAYDNDSQLLTVADTSGHSGVAPAESFAYTANGNRDQTGFATGGDNELTQAPAPTSGYHYEYAFDNEGNRTDRYLKNASGSTFEHVHYVWDYRARLREVDTYNASSVLTSKARYGYDAMDRRVSKAVDSNGDGTDDAVEGYVYDEGSVLCVG